MKHFDNARNVSDLCMNFISTIPGQVKTGKIRISIPYENPKFPYLVYKKTDISRDRIFYLHLITIQGSNILTWLIISLSSPSTVVNFPGMLVSAVVKSNSGI